MFGFYFGGAKIDCRGVKIDFDMYDYSLVEFEPRI